MNKLIIISCVALSACANTQNLGKKLERIGAATGGANSLARYDACVANPTNCKEEPLPLEENFVLYKGKVFPEGDCIGPSVAGVCRGSVIDTGQGRTCHGKWLNGHCTGPLF